MDNSLTNKSQKGESAVAKNKRVRQYEGNTSECVEGFLGAIFDFYVSGYYLDLNEERYYAIGQQSIYNDLYGDTNPWSYMDVYIRDSIHPDDQALITEVSRIPYIRKRLKREKSYSIDVRDLATGSERWYRYRTMRGKDPDHAAISFADVTDEVLSRQELERLTQATQEELELNTTLGIYSWRITIDEKNNMRYVDWSENACEFMDIKAKPEQHASMRTMYNIIHPDLLPAFITELQKTVMDESGKYVFNFDNKQDMDDGTVKWFHCSGRKVTLSNGTGWAIVGAFRDVTDSHIVKEERQELAAVRDLMQAARWTAQFDYDGSVSSVTFSDEVRRVLGYENEDDFPNDEEFLRSIMHPDDAEDRDETLAAAIADSSGKTQYDIKYRLRCKDGSYLWVRSAIRIRRDEVGNAESAIGVFVDISDSVLRAQAERELREANEEQNAQLEEITALNTELQDNQAKLEEVSAEQEAQIEEIGALNDELSEQKMNLERHLDAVSSLSKLYYASYYVDVDNDEHYELLAGGEISSSYGEVRTKGKSQAALNWMCDNRIDPEYQDAARAFTDYSTLSERMKDTEEVSLLVKLVTGDWARIRFIAGSRHEDGTLKSCTFVARNVNDEHQAEMDRRRELEERMEEIKALNSELEENQARLEELASEQEAQLAETQALNEELEERQTQLEEATAEQEAQIEEISALNAEVESSRDSLSEAYGMVEGFSQEYHTIWVVSKETSKMKLVRSNGKNTIQGAIQMGIDEPLMNPTVVAYANAYIEPEDRDRFIRDASFEEVVRQLEEHPDETYRITYLRRTEDGEVGYHQIAFANADTKDGHHRFVYGFRDVDTMVREEHAKQEALREARDAADAANKAKSSFLFNMSHDIRTPMNAIIGFTNLLEKHQDDAKKRGDYLRKINDSSGVLLGIINNVLDMARIESGAMSLNEKPCSVSQITVAAASVFGEMMAEKGIEFIETADCQHEYVWCDSTKVTQIINNIVSNAYKYTKTGGRVDLQLEEVADEREGWTTLKLTVSDTGIGMDAEFIPTIFEEFTREHTSTETRIEGTGLGMPIVKRLVELMDGSIDVQSEKGVGTTVTVVMPMRLADGTDAEESSDVEPDEDTFVGKRVLLAEDNDLNAEIAREILGEVGFTVERAEDGVVAVKRIEEVAAGYYDLILMDIQMPEMNGYEATHIIRSMEDEAKAHIPILAMTANAFEEDKREALRVGMNGHIAKPIDVPMLMRTLAKILE